VTRRPVVDTAASVRQRLLNIARDKDRPFNEVLQYFAMERFLYRLGKSDHGRKFILKGALMLVAWEAPLARSTKDIDLLGRMKNTIEDVVDPIKAACSLEVIPDPDGLLFDVKSVVGQRIAEEADYEGVRVRFRGNLGNARITMQVDVGFGDVIVPGPDEVDYPTLLDLPAPRLLGYSRESAIAEKFEAMVKRGILNSRMKDFFDIWLLSRQFEFNGRPCRTRFGKPSPIGKRKFPCRLLRSLKHFPMIPRRFCNGGHLSGNPVSLRSRNPSGTSSHTSRFFEDFQKRMEFPFPVGNRGRTDVLGDQDRHGTPLGQTLDDREKNDFRHHIGDVECGQFNRGGHPGHRTIIGPGGDSRCRGGSGGSMEILHQSLKIPPSS